MPDYFACNFGEIHLFRNGVKKMTLTQFINSPFFIVILTAFWGVSGWAFTSLFTKIRSMDAKISKLEIEQIKFDQSSIELINIRSSLQGFGSRIGDTESEMAVMQSNHTNVMDSLKEIRSSEKETAQAFISTLTDLQKTIQNMSVDIACIKQKIGV